jgi:hypothetical protein
MELTTLDGTQFFFTAHRAELGGLSNLHILKLNWVDVGGPFLPTELWASWTEDKLLDLELELPFGPRELTRVLCPLTGESGKPQEFGFALQCQD